MKRIATVLCFFAGALVASAQGEGYTDTPIIRGQKWRVHDKERPNPKEVKPGATFSHGAPPPEDATVLFDGTDFSAWEKDGGGAPSWKVENGYVEAAKGSVHTKQEFGDFQLHIEWASPNPPRGHGQDRGNSGVFLQGRYEVQVLDSYQAKTYADGQAGGLYGQWPPLVNPIKPPGEWNTYDIAFEAPHFDADGKLTKPAYVTVFFNGVCVHNRKELNGPTNHRVSDPYKPYSGMGPIGLQDHGHPVHYRNIWIRPLGQYN
jgi:Domain of Unknown Function (DUF1080)